MLFDVVMACAALVAASPAGFAALSTHASVSRKGRLQKQLYGTLLLAEKLPPNIVGAGQIASDIDSQTLHLAYVAQYPQRSREIVNVALIGAIGVIALVGFYVMLAAGAPLAPLLIGLGVIAVASLWFERVVVNYGRNDSVSRELFAHFGAPENLIRPRTELVARMPATSLATVFERAAAVRDAWQGAPMSSLDAVNAALAEAYEPFDWRAESRKLAGRVSGVDYRGHAATARSRGAELFASSRQRAADVAERVKRTDYRSHARKAAAHGSSLLDTGQRESKRLADRASRTDYRTYAEGATSRGSSYLAKVYGWLLRHLVGPFFALRLSFLDWLERRRIARARARGDVLQSAWLPAHYRNERERLARHWSHLHGVRDPLQRRSADGAATPAPEDGAATREADERDLARMA